MKAAPGRSRRRTRGGSAAHAASPSKRLLRRHAARARRAHSASRSARSGRHCRATGSGRSGRRGSARPAGGAARATGEVMFIGGGLREQQLELAAHGRAQRVRGRARELLAVETGRVGGSGAGGPPNRQTRRRTASRIWRLTRLRVAARLACRFGTTSAKPSGDVIAGTELSTDSVRSGAASVGNSCSNWPVCGALARQSAPSWPRWGPTAALSMRRRPGPPRA